MSQNESIPTFENAQTASVLDDEVVNEAMTTDHEDVEIVDRASGDDDEFFENLNQDLERARVQTRSGVNTLTSEPIEIAAKTPEGPRTFKKKNLQISNDIGQNIKKLFTFESRRAQFVLKVG